MPLDRRRGADLPRSPAVDRRELMQEGVVGLLRALSRYDLGQGTPFWAYASWWVRQAMQQLVSELTRPVVLSDRAARQLARVKDVRREYVQATAGSRRRASWPTDAGLPRRQVENLLVAERSPRALDEPSPATRASWARSATCSPTRTPRPPSTACRGSSRSERMLPLLDAL